MAKILCLETATSVCSVAYFDNDKLISSREIDEGFRHSELLTVFIGDVLAEANISINQIDAVAVSSGPGSYTGLRIGMSVAKGISFSCDVPLIVIPTLELLAAGAITDAKNNAELFCPMIDARRMEVYCALYDKKLNLLKPASAIVIDDGFFNDINENVLYFGDGAEKCKGVLRNNFIYSENIFPSAKNMGKIAFGKFESGSFENVSLVEPVYLKEFQLGRK